MEKLKMGQLVWWATFTNKTESKLCPVCFGKTRVTLILGDGEEVSLECQYCSSGYQRATGYVSEYNWVLDVKKIMIEKVSIEETITGEKREYYYQNYIISSDCLFKTKEEAEKKALELKEIHEQKEIERETSIKNSGFRSYSCKAGYHTKCVNQARKDIEYHEKMSIICKNKSRANKIPKIRTVKH